MADWVVRRATPDDAEAVLHLVNSVVAEHMFLATERVTRTAEQLAAEFAAAATSSHRLYLVAGRERQIMGHLWLRQEGAGLLPKVAHIVTLGMAVAAPYRGKGAGTALMRDALDWARSCGYAKVELSVIETNDRALALYRKFAFAEEGRRPLHFLLASGPCAEFLMGLVLRGPGESPGVQPYEPQ